LCIPQYIGFANIYKSCFPVVFMDLKKAVKTRKSVRYFAPKAADWRKIVQAIDYARFAPAADSQFVNKFILISDSEAIKGIAAAAQQNFIEEASHVVVVTSDSSSLVKRYGDCGERWAAQQTGAAIENFLLGLNERGLASGWVGHFSDELVKDALEIPKEITIEAIFPIGRESRARKALEGHHPELDNIIYFDKWDNTEMEPQTRVSVANS
jgi:nitroreductase